ncbi:unnamed protein product, partial [Mesorhabditis belari]|uniref:Uncharacterized protein n=1 Tax=Mesorhabditis belari TaxID=2138241 RepID=A0AAF3J8P1_9BILA
MTTVFWAECSGVFFGDAERTEKLIVTGPGDWDMGIKKIPISTFDTREEFDRFVLNPEEQLPDEPTIQEIYLEDALKMINVNVEVNADFYREHLDVLEKDLDADLDLQQLQYFFNGPGNDQELLFKVLTKHVEEEIPEIDHNPITWEKHLMVYEMRIVLRDGNTWRATCRRGENYFLLSFDTS